MKNATKVNDITFAPAMTLDTKYVSELVQEMKKHLANAQRLRESTVLSSEMAKELCDKIQEAAAKGDFQELTNLNYERLAHEQKTGAARQRGIDSMEKLEESRKVLVTYLIDALMPEPTKVEIPAVQMPDSNEANKAA